MIATSCLQMPRSFAPWESGTRRSRRESLLAGGTMELTPERIRYQAEALARHRRVRHQLTETEYERRMLADGLLHALVDEQRLHLVKW